MFTVALVGPDGAGKTTISRRLLETLDLPMKYIYMGINLEASNVMLPTTWLQFKLKKARQGALDMGGPRDPSKSKPLPKNPFKRAVYELKSGFRMINLIAEEWFRQAVIWLYVRRGYVVLFDRHFFFDYYYHDVVQKWGERPLSSKLHGWMLKNLYPRPELVIFLDAPAEVLFARKGEGTVELIEQRRQEYLQMRGLFENFVTVDATQPQEKVVQDAVRLVREFHQTKVMGRDRNLSVVP
jgi:thymidylate kinase